jgi:hypothetical protein
MSHWFRDIRAMVMTIAAGAVFLGLAATQATASTPPDTNATPAAASASSCLVRMIAVDGPELGVRGLASVTDAVALVHVDSIGAATWDTSDGKRPSPVKGTRSLISRPVELTVRETWSGSIASGHVRARILGGTVGCDRVLTEQSQELAPGDYVVFLSSGRSGNAAALGSLSIVTWLPVTADAVSTPVDGALSLASARQMVSAVKK